MIYLEGTPAEPKMAQESRDDPHWHLGILYVIAVVVSAATAVLIK
jgi:hypothetical protein